MQQAQIAQGTRSYARHFRRGGSARRGAWTDGCARRALLTIDDDKNFRLEVQVEESFLSSLKVGDKVNVRIDSLPGRTLDGKVQEVVPSIDPSSRTFTVKIALPSVPDVHSECTARHSSCVA